MKVAYLINRESLGGGCEYVRRTSERRRNQGADCRTLYSAKGECTAAAVNAWGADEIVVNHLRALVQLYRNPFVRPQGRVTFVVHGIHLRKYLWRMHESAAASIFAGPAYLLRRALEALLYHRCDRILALTESDRADILKLYGRSLRVELESDMLAGWEPVLADSLPPGVTGQFKYLYIGRFDYQKGQDRFLRWFAAARQEPGQPSAARVLFIGDGRTLQKCRTLAARLGVADACVFAGAVPMAERYLKCAAAVASFSRWEGRPYLLMKARALGCRILATDCPGNRDVLADYANWQRVSPD